MKKYLVLFLVLGAQALLALTNSAPAEDTSWSSVTMIKVNAKDDTGEVVPGYCVATFVKTNVLITAAHCVNMAIGMNDRGIEIHFGHYIYHTMPDGSQRRIGYKQDAPIVTAGSFLIPSQNVSPTNDFAVIVLDQQIELPTDMSLAQIATPAEVAGVQNSIVTYWPTVVTVNPFEDMSTDTRRMARLNDFKKSGGYYQSQSISRVEPGDSGSPVFIKIGTQWKMMAVVKGFAKTFYSDWDVFESIDDNICAAISGKVSQDLQKSLCLH